MRPTLYYAPGSCAFASLVCLCEAGASFEARRVLLSEGEQHSDWFRAINPRGRVPAFATGGVMLSETIAVLTYVATQWPDAGLLPIDDPVELGRAYDFMSWLATSVQVTIAQLWRSERFLADPDGIAMLRAAAPERLDAAFAEINQRIVGPWVLGTSFSALDPYLSVFRRWAVRLETDMTRFPQWQAQQARLEARPAYNAALAIEAGPETILSKVI